ARAFGAEGARVALCGRTRRKVDDVARQIEEKGGTALPLVVDVTQKASVAQGVRQVEERFGPVEILVNNAGISGITRLDDDTEACDERWHEIIETNLTGPYLLTRAVAPRMPTGGRILNISSVLGRFAVPGYAAYCASKHGLLGLTRTHALELAPRGITVNALCPGWVETEMADIGIQRLAEELGVSPEVARKKAIAALPIRRFLSPEEIARYALFLCSEAASGITGQGIDISCGAVMI
ncbi:MAG: SDR family oxidoreductase, partial [Deltaproteobacteria bacterium]